MADAVYKKFLDNHPLWYIWGGMRARCNNPKNPRYADWGGRGIKCGWESYEEFQNDMLPTYKKGMQLDRIDNDKNYSKNNCKWSTIKEQTRNKRNSRFITYKGLTLILSDWAELMGIKRSTLAQRHYVYKWPLEKLFTK